jgi:hypothetical protein
MAGYRVECCLPPLRINQQHDAHFTLGKGMYQPGGLSTDVAVGRDVSGYRALGEDADRVSRFRPALNQGRKKTPEKPVSQGGRGYLLFRERLDVLRQCDATAGVWKSS